MTVRHASLLLALVACGSDRRDPPPSPPPASVPRDPGLTAPPVDAPAIDAPPPAPPPSDPAPPGITATFTVDGDAYPLPFGYASSSAEGIFVTLAAHRVDCKRTTYGAPKDTILNFTIPVGSGDYFSGRWISTSMIGSVLHKKTHMERAGMVLDMDYTNGVTGAGAMVNAAVPKLAAGAHITGELGARGANLLGAIAITGHFDVELCDAPSTETKPLAAQPPAGALHGSRGGKPFAPVGTVHAFVSDGSSTTDNAIDVSIHRAHGDLPEIFFLYFYAEPNVPCETEFASNPAGTLVAAAQGIGGTSVVRQVLGASQPTSLLLYKGKTSRDDMDEIWPAAVILDGPLDYTEGAKLKGAIWARESHYSDVKGAWGGHFEAIVCHPAPR